MPQTQWNRTWLDIYRLRLVLHWFFYELRGSEQPTSSEHELMLTGRMAFNQDAPGIGHWCKAGDRRVCGSHAIEDIARAHDRQRFSIIGCWAGVGLELISRKRLDYHQKRAEICKYVWIYTWIVTTNLCVSETAIDPRQYIWMSHWKPSATIVIHRPRKIGQRTAMPTVQRLRGRDSGHVSAVSTDDRKHWYRVERNLGNATHSDWWPLE